MKRKSLLLISMSLVFAIVFSMFSTVFVGAETDTDGPELVHTMNFSSDSKWSPISVNGATDRVDYIAGDNGASLTIKGKAGASETDGNFWGATITGLAADANTVYTMTYKAKANGDKGKNNSIGVGGWIVNGDVQAHEFYNNYTNHNTNTDQRSALQLNNFKIQGYVMLNTLAAFDEDENGFVTMKQVYDGKQARVISYILADGKTGEKAADWIMIESQPMVLGTNDAFGFMIYSCYNIVDTTIKDVKIYREGQSASGDNSDSSGETGTTAETYLISTKEELLAAAALYNEGETPETGLQFKLTADIDLGGMDWTPIHSADSEKLQPEKRPRLFLIL